MLAGLLVLGGCVQDPLPSAAADVLVEEEIPLPPPPGRILTAGVYSCIDTTGQRRPTQLPQELSTAVPMDCTPYLIEAVRSIRSGYVLLVERQHVDELLRERQIATLALNGSAEVAGHRHPGRLAVIRAAELLLVGQIVAYDRETRQVSGGIALGGLGTTSTLVTDMITFSLRAVAVQTGEILGQTTVTKSITSLKAGVHLTKIFTTSVLDFELGGAGNEPVGLALRAAVRSALGRLITKGMHDGWWA